MKKNRASWGYLHPALPLFLLLASPLFSQIPYAIIGGEDVSSNTPYAAFVSSSGVTTAITGLPITLPSYINSAAINSSGNALIGGRNGNDPYIAIVPPSGVASAVTGSGAPSATGLITAVAINSSGAGIAGGSQNNDPYAVIISPLGVATQISGSGSPSGSGQIYAVTINSSGAGIVGGNENTNNTYAVLVSSTGMTTPLTGSNLYTGTGHISSVAINDSGNGLIGGSNVNSLTPYVALVNSSGVTSSLSGPNIPTGTGFVLAVAINNSGNGIIGGIDVNAATPYVALVNSSGVTSGLSGGVPSGSGEILCVAINSSSSCIIGGHDVSSTTPYAALVSPSGVATSITGIPSSGSGLIISAAINDAGVGIIGGEVNGNADPYAALVSPTGILTPLSGSGLYMGSGYINGVAITPPAAGPSVLTLVVPTSFGIGNSFANGSFALSASLLPNHCMSLMRQIQSPRGSETAALFSEQEELLASNQEISFQMRPKRKECPLPPENQKPICREVRFSPWAAVLGEKAKQKAVEGFPALQDWIGGAMVGLDYLGLPNVLIGVGGAYAFNYVHFSDKVGHAKVQQEFATLYFAKAKEYAYLNVALWGGMYQMYNERHSLGIMTSTSNSKGWLLIPHLEFGVPIRKKKVLVDPFIMLDWANNWQGRIQENGPSGFNLVIGHQYVSLLRSEAGLRLFETISCSWGKIILQEKASYVNKKPFNVPKTSAVFIGSISPFSIDTFSTEVQNLGVGQFNLTFEPYKTACPYGSLNYQGEFGSSFQSNLVSFELGWQF